MTNEEINMAIAEYCDYYIWADDECPNAFQLRHGREICKNPIRDHPSDCWHFDAPNYADDLNACHSFENEIINDAEDGYHYDMFLCRVVNLIDPSTGLPIFMNLWHATARQRCEALLRMINKWKE